jgi:nucleotide-binding universal stress UspA family protein
LIAGIHRVLLPLRRRDEPDDVTGVQTVEASLLERIGLHTDLSVTLFNIAQPGKKADGEAYLKDVATIFNKSEVVRKVVEADRMSNAILDEAAKDYDLLVLGASERHRSGDTLFSPLVDSLVRMAPVPTMVVQGPRQLEDWAPERILVPVTGTEASRHAVELAFALARPGKKCVMIMHVIEPVAGITITAKRAVPATGRGSTSGHSRSSTALPSLVDCMRWKPTPWWSKAAARRRRSSKSLPASTLT